MPIYEYKCDKCDLLFEKLTTVSDTDKKECPNCGALSPKVPSSKVGLVFKGSGFYITDYTKKNASSANSTMNVNNKTTESKTPDQSAKSSESTTTSEVSK